MSFCDWIDEDESDFGEPNMDEKHGGGGHSFFNIHCKFAEENLDHQKFSADEMKSTVSYCHET